MAYQYSYINNEQLTNFLASVKTEFAKRGNPVSYERLDGLGDGLALPTTDSIYTTILASQASATIGPLLAIKAKDATVRTINAGTQAALDEANNILAGLQGVTDKTIENNAGCYGACQGYCYGSCYSSCTDDCHGVSGGGGSNSNSQGTGTQQNWSGSDCASIAHNCAGSCYGDCSGISTSGHSCRSWCASGCSGGCAWSCSQVCNGQCKGTCKGCNGGCYTNCTGLCLGACTSCSGACSGTCGTTCANYCHDNCSNGCGYTCSGAAGFY